MVLQTSTAPSIFAKVTPEDLHLLLLLLDGPFGDFIRAFRPLPGPGSPANWNKQQKRDKNTSLRRDIIMFIYVYTLGLENSCFFFFSQFFFLINKNWDVDIDSSRKDLVPEMLPRFFAGGMVIQLRQLTRGNPAGNDAGASPLPSNWFPMFLPPFFVGETLPKLKHRCSTIHGYPVDEAHDGFSNSPMVAKGQGECWCLDPNSQVNSYFTQFVAKNPDVLLVDTLVNHQISPDSWWNPVAIPSISLPNELKGETMAGNSRKFLWKVPSNPIGFRLFWWFFLIFFPNPIEFP